MAQTTCDYFYFVTFIADYFNFTMVYLLKHKSEVFDNFKEYFNMVQSKFNIRISKFGCDGGGEYISNSLKQFCVDKGIFINYTVPYNAQENGKAERMNRSLVEKARAMINESGVNKYFWGEAIRVANYLINRSPSRSLDFTPAEIWYKKKPNVSNLRVFGCTAYSLVPKQFRDKFDGKTDKCIKI